MFKSIFSLQFSVLYLLSLGFLNFAYAVDDYDQKLLEQHEDHGGMFKIEEVSATDYQEPPNSIFTVPPVPLVIESESDESEEPAPSSLEEAWRRFNNGGAVPVPPQNDTDTSTDTYTNFPDYQLPPPPTRARSDEGHIPVGRVNGNRQDLTRSANDVQNNRHSGAGAAKAQSSCQIS